MTDDLRERIEAGVDAAMLHGSTAEEQIDRVTAFCESIVREERERWGHVERCRCHTAKTCDGGCAPEPFHYDPRCAPQAERVDPSGSTCPVCRGDDSLCPDHQPKQPATPSADDDDISSHAVSILHQPPSAERCPMCLSPDRDERWKMQHAPENVCTDNWHPEPCPECGYGTGHKESCPAYWPDIPTIPRIATKVRLPVERCPTCESDDWRRQLQAVTVDGGVIPCQHEFHSTPPRKETT